MFVRYIHSDCFLMKEAKSVFILFFTGVLINNQQSNSSEKFDGSVYNPSKSKYHPIDDACWKRGQTYVNIYIYFININTKNL